MYRRELHPPPTIIQSLDKGLGSLQDWLTSLASLSGPIRFALSTVHTVQCTHCLAYWTKLHHWSSILRTVPYLHVLFFHVLRRKRTTLLFYFRLPHSLASFLGVSWHFCVVSYCISTRIRNVIIQCGLCGRCFSVLGPEPYTFPLFALIQCT